MLVFRSCSIIGSHDFKHLNDLSAHSIIEHRRIDSGPHHVHCSRLSRCCLSLKISKITFLVQHAGKRDCRRARSGIKILKLLLMQEIKGILHSRERVNNIKLGEDVDLQVIPDSTNIHRYMIKLVQLAEREGNRYDVGKVPAYLGRAGTSRLDDCTSRCISPAAQFRYR